MTLNSEHWPEVLENCGGNNNGFFPSVINTNLNSCNYLNGIDNFDLA